MPPPRPFVEEIAHGLPAGRALDLACGDGRNAVWLADRGWQVTAVDREPTFTDPRVEIVAADLEQNQFNILPAAWDLILMSYYLQPDLYPAVMRGLKSQGIAIMIVLLHDPTHKSGRFRVSPGQLRGHFRDDDILCYREESGVAQIAVRAIN
jgi:SAM-dependent methyltransferase